MGVCKVAQPVSIGGDFLLVIKDPCHIDSRGIELERKNELTGHPGLHIDGTATPELSGFTACREKPFDRNRIEVTGDDDAGVTAALNSSGHRITHSDDLKVVCSAEGCLNAIGEFALVS